jgi:hypothetical protein
MANTDKKELANRLQKGILEILGEFHPTLSKKLKKEAKVAGKELSKKMLEIQISIEKKAHKVLKKQKEASEKKKDSDKKERPKAKTKKADPKSEG